MHDPAGAPGKGVLGLRHVQASVPSTCKLPRRVMGAKVETVAFTLMGGLKATSICVIRREPLGVIASEVSNQTGFIVSALAEVMLGQSAGTPGGPGTTHSCFPSQHTCLSGPLPLSTSCPLSSPIWFCLLVMRTHLKGSAPAVLLFGISLAVKTTVLPAVTAAVW